MSAYQPLRRYKHFNVARHSTILYGISSFEQPSGLLPSLANTTASYLVLVLVYTPDL